MKHQATLWRNFYPLILMMGAGLVHSGCLGEAQPERVVQGAITDLEDRPLEGAAVSVAGRVALTDAQGAFVLAGLPEATTGPLHVSAAGYTAWTLDRVTLARLRARLRPLGARAEIQGSTLLNLTLELPAATQQGRDVYLSLDGGEVIPVQLLEETRHHTLSLRLAPGEHTLSAISPHAQEGPLASAPLAVTLPPQGGSLTISLRHSEPLVMSLQPSAPEALELGAELAITCQDSGDHTSLVSYGAQPQPDGCWRMELFSLPSAGPCRLVATWELDEGRGPVSHVAFTSFQAEAAPQELALTLPPVWPLHLEIDPQSGAMSWDPVEGASVYDVFLAPVQGDGRLASPLWSATTASSQLRLPSLPAPALERIAWSPGQDLAVRVVARFAPDLDLEENWDWSSYYGYISSPWELGTDSLTRPWSAPP